MNGAPLCRLWRWTGARFSFKGRATRLEFWLTALCAVVFAVLGFVLTAGICGVLFRILAHAGMASGHVIFVVGLVLALLVIVLYGWLCFAVAIRRTHDLGFSYHESLRFKVNIQGGFKRGTLGPNAYGPDPLQNKGAA